MENFSAAWVALALTVVVQAVGIGIFIGATRTEMRRLRKDLEGHQELPIPRGHGCPYFGPRSEHDP